MTDPTAAFQQADYRRKALAGFGKAAAPRRAGMSFFAPSAPASAPAPPAPDEQHQQQRAPAVPASVARVSPPVCSPAPPGPSTVARHSPATPVPPRAAAPAGSASVKFSGGKRPAPIAPAATASAAGASVGVLDCDDDAVLAEVDIDLLVECAKKSRVDDAPPATTAEHSPVGGAVASNRTQSEVLRCLHQVGLRLAQTVAPLHRALLDSWELGPVEAQLLEQQALQQEFMMLHEELRVARPDAPAQPDSVDLDVTLNSATKPAQQLAHPSAVGGSAVVDDDWEAFVDPHDLWDDFDPMLAGAARTSAVEAAPRSWEPYGADNQYAAQGSGSNYSGGNNTGRTGGNSYLGGGGGSASYGDAWYGSGNVGGDNTSFGGGGSFGRNYGGGNPSYGDNNYGGSFSYGGHPESSSSSSSSSSSNALWSNSAVGDFGSDFGFAQPSEPLSSTAMRQSAMLPATDERSAAYWDRDTHPLVRRAVKVRQEVFGHHSWRVNQLGIVNATLAKRDVFVLMPTGGGKSLTYQLPGLCSFGVTVVVSPLISLIHDQVAGLKQLDVSACYLSSTMSQGERQSVFESIFNSRSGQAALIKFLFVTPEMLNSSGKLTSALQFLVKEHMLERFVIDEAHCISNWGHDFRPDYQSLKVLKGRYPEVPIMALTATATTKVRGDILRSLNIPDAIVFEQSFNRANLRYEVRPKKKDFVSEIADWIRQHYDRRCGIVYCLSQKDCEKTAASLKERGINAGPYHAGLAPAAREAMHMDWLQDRCHVICATIAFGMGINKPDVRFVIHHSMPKSLEGYYQEAGRAGRDGLVSHCLLYFSYKDKARLQSMIQSNKDQMDSYDTLNGHLSNLTRVVEYCENTVDCRRQQVLLYFGENFDPVQCGQTCDNCTRFGHVEERDVTQHVINLHELVKSFLQHGTGARMTVPQLVDVYRGADNKLTQRLGGPSLIHFGMGKKDLSRAEAERVIHIAIRDRFLDELVMGNDYGGINAWVAVGAARPADMRAYRAVMKSRSESGRSTAATTAEDQQNEAIKTRHPELFARLYELRRVIFAEEKTAPFSESVICAIMGALPSTMEELSEVPNVGSKRASKYGERILSIVDLYVREYGIARPAIAAGGGGGGGGDGGAGGGAAFSATDNTSSSGSGLRKRERPLAAAKDFKLANRQTFDNMGGVGNSSSSNNNNNNNNNSSGNSSSNSYNGIKKAAVAPSSSFAATGPKAAPPSTGSKAAPPSSSAKVAPPRLSGNGGNSIQPMTLTKKAAPVIAQREVKRYEFGAQ